MAIHTSILMHVAWTILSLQSIPRSLYVQIRQQGSFFKPKLPQYDYDVNGSFSNEER